MNENILDTKEFYIGLALAICSCIFIGSSFVLKKKALITVSRSGSLRVGAGGYGYLKEWIWWTGLLLMGGGEVINFVAYLFAPASLVTPLGALSIPVTSVLASYFLNETINLLGKIGCILCVLGSTIIVIHSPQEQEISTLSVLLEKLQDLCFIIYMLIIIVASFSIIFYFGPKYGSRNILVYIILCSAIGSLSVLFCKALGLAIKETFSHADDYYRWLTYSFLTTLVACVFVQMNYLNRALDLFSTSIVIPIYYVCFTIFVLIASSVLFKEWKHSSSHDVIGSLCGFLVVIVAIILLNAFKDVSLNINDMKHIVKPKKDLLIVDTADMEFFNYSGSQKWRNNKP